MKNFEILNLYKNAFSGLSRNAWMLSLIMFVNRSGTMVVPFLSIYLTSSLGFTIQEAGYCLAIFGIGSVIGTFLGGWLTDKIGNFKVQVFSLIGGGILFLIVLNLRTFYSFSIGIFFLSLISESLRPANAASVASYANPENITRAYALNRMALNLGFAIGPALGGFFAAISYKFLFMADGLTCILAGLFFYFYFKNKTQIDKNLASIKSNKSSSPIKDKRFMMFVLLTSLFAICFFQIFATLPLFYRDIMKISEFEIGTLLALNGIIVFSFEMILVYVLNNRVKLSNMIIMGVLLTGVSFWLLNFSNHKSILYISMILVSFAEIFAMPFMATFAVERSTEQNRGSFMAMYSVAYSVSHIFAPIVGTQLIYLYGFKSLWETVMIISIINALAFYILFYKKAPAIEH